MHRAVVVEDIAHLRAGKKRKGHAEDCSSGLHVVNGQGFIYLLLLELYNISRHMGNGLFIYLSRRRVIAQFRKRIGRQIQQILRFQVLLIY